MSYDIYIGNAEVAAHGDEVEDYDGEYCAEYYVAGMTHPDAPSFAYDTMTGNGNSRHPGYAQWGEFVDAVGLRDLFFHKFTGIMRRHPGCFALTSAHLALVQGAMAEWNASHPDAEPGWDYHERHARAVDDGVRGRDHILARLIWLEWWMGYALDNCPRPAIYNR